MREVLSSPPDDYLRAMARRLLALSLLLAVVTVGATDAWAHSDDGEMTVTNAEQSGPNTVQVQVGIVSYGLGCATPLFPGVYGEVNNASIHEFITSTAGLGATTDGGTTDDGTTKGNKGGNGKGKNQR